MNAVLFDTQPIRSFLFQNWMVLLTLDNVPCTTSFGKDKKVLLQFGQVVERSLFIQKRGLQLVSLMASMNIPAIRLYHEELRKHSAKAW